MSFFPFFSFFLGKICSTCILQLCTIFEQMQFIYAHRGEISVLNFSTSICLSLSHSVSSCVIDRKLLMPHKASYIVTCLMNDHYVLKLQNVLTMFVCRFIVPLFHSYSQQDIARSYLLSDGRGVVERGGHKWKQWLYNYWNFTEFHVQHLHTYNPFSTTHARFHIRCAVEKKWERISEKQQ